MGTGDDQRESASSNGSESQESTEGIRNLLDLRDCIQDSPHFRYSMLCGLNKAVDLSRLQHLMNPFLVAKHLEPHSYY